MSKVFIIAEAGVNHNGSLRLAKKLVDAAAKAGADAVKFQTFSADRLVLRSASKAAYQRASTGADEKQWTMIKRLELDAAAHRELISYCQKKKIIFLSSPFDLESIDLLAALGLKILKIPSGEITNLPYLRKIGGLRKDIILSTGMSSLMEIRDAVNILVKAGTSKMNITVLHCNTGYPTPYKDVNLRAMMTIQKILGVDVGYSDHTLGTGVAVAAVALGASVIEKHFTLDKGLPGPDHKVSLDFDELKYMINAVRSVEMALGSGIKEMSPSEKVNKSVARKSIVAAAGIEKGERFTGTNIAVKRPGTGISPMQWDNVIGKTARRDFRKDDLIIL